MTMEYSASEIEAGKVAYEAYREFANGKSLISGEELPSFDDLQATIREAWAVSARAVMLRYGAIY